MESGTYSPTVVDPEIVTVFCDGKELECFAVDICGDEYDVCCRTTEGDNFASNSKRGEYGRGVCRTDEEPFLPAKSGRLGEMAFGKIFGSPIDTAYRRNGDRQDFILGHDIKVDIKCATRNYGECRMICTKENGQNVPLDKDVYVSSFIESDDRDAKKARIVIVGFSLRNDIVSGTRSEKKRGKGRWMNQVLRFSRQRPIRHLSTMLKKYPSMA